MTDTPRVTIAIPVYNGADYLRMAIDSALSQTYANVEVLVVNDGSTDGGATEAIARSFEGRIRYVGKPNGGVASALNVAVREMSGAYLSWLSHDDTYSPDKVSRQVARMRSLGRPVILYCDYDIIDADSRVTGSFQGPDLDPRAFRYALTVSYPINGCATLIPKECFETVGTFDEALRTTQDYDLWFRLAARYDFVHQSERLMQSRHHVAQGTHALRPLHLKECNEMYERFVEALSPDDLAAGSGASPAVAYARIAGSLKRRGYVGAARAAGRRCVEAAGRSGAGLGGTTLELARCAFAYVRGAAG